MTEYALYARSLRKSFQDGRSVRTVIDAVDLTVGVGEIVGLVGRSGCGKTTLLRLASGLLKPDAGTVEVSGLPLDYDRHAEARRIRLEHIGIIDQDYILLEEESILDNVELPLKFATPRQGRTARRETALRAIADAGLDVHEAVKVRRLSGGERQRVAVARALVRHPTFLVADEPTAALDADTGHKVISTLRQVAEVGVGVLVATHDANVVDLCDRVYYFDGPCLREGIRASTSRDAWV